MRSVRRLLAIIPTRTVNLPANYARVERMKLSCRTDWAKDALGEMLSCKLRLASSRQLRTENELPQVRGSTRTTQRDGDPRLWRLLKSYGCGPTGCTGSGLRGVSNAILGTAATAR